MKIKHTSLYQQPKHLATAIALLLLCCTHTSYTQNTQDTKQITQKTEQIAQQTLAATVYLEMKDATGKTISIGSGFFIKPNLIATNYHVIAGATTGTVKVVGKITQYNIEGVTAVDKTNDLSLLQVTMSGIKPLPLGNSSTLQIGETVYVAGNPVGLEGTFSQGMISSIRNPSNKERLQITAPISSGSSGGPVINKAGEVIGVAYMTIEGGQNLNFAIPSHHLEILLAISTQEEPWTFGDPQSQSIFAKTISLHGHMLFNHGYYAEAIVAFTKDISDSDLMAARAASLGMATDAFMDHNNFMKCYKYESRAQAYEQIGQYDAAIQDYNKIIELKPDNADVYFNRGRVKARIGQFNAAIKDFNKAIELKPDFANAYPKQELMKIVKHLRRQYGAAIQDYNKIIERHPDLLYFYYIDRGDEMGIAAARQTIKDYDKAIELKPDDYYAYFARGRAKHRLEQYDDAIQDYDHAIELKPGNADTYFYRGIAKQKLGREWKQDIHTALKLAEESADTKLIGEIKQTFPSLE